MRRRLLRQNGALDRECWYYAGLIVPLLQRPLRERLCSASPQGRAAVARWLRVRAPVVQRVERLARSALGALPLEKWLAVHVRLTDKLYQNPTNAIPRHRIRNKVIAFCAALGCAGAFLCSDDGQLKRLLAADLRSAHLEVATLDVALSSTGQAAHLDAELDSRRNAEDVLVEALLMSRCAALISTCNHSSKEGTARLAHLPICPFAHLPIVPS